MCSAIDPRPPHMNGLDVPVCLVGWCGNMTLLVVSLYRSFSRSVGWLPFLLGCLPWIIEVIGWIG